MSVVDQAAQRYAIEQTSPPTDAVAALRSETEAAMEKPQMAGGYVEVKLLEALVVASRARRVLEIGTFTGISALSMAARLPADGRLITIEANPDHAAVARKHIEASPLADRIEIVVGDALEHVHRLEGPFDLVFIDAWKADYPSYYEAVVPLLAPHGVIVADNVLWGGSVLEEEPADGAARVLRAFAQQVRVDPRVDSALLTVGDGLLLIWRR
ncbi:MAG: O-methyltransferase [Gaiella sp.]